MERVIPSFTVLSSFATLLTTGPNQTACSRNILVLAQGQVRLLAHPQGPNLKGFGETVGTRKLIGWRLPGNSSYGLVAGKGWGSDVCLIEEDWLVTSEMVSKAARKRKPSVTAHHWQ